MTARHADAQPVEARRRDLRAAAGDDAVDQCAVGDAPCHRTCGVARVRYRHDPACRKNGIDFIEIFSGIVKLPEKFDTSCSPSDLGHSGNRQLLLVCAPGVSANLVQAGVASHRCDLMLASLTFSQKSGGGLTQSVSAAMR